MKTVARFSVLVSGMIALVGGLLQSSQSSATSVIDSWSNPLLDSTLIQFTGSQNPGVGAGHFVTNELAALGVTFSPSSFRLGSNGHWVSQFDNFLYDEADNLTRSIYFSSNVSGAVASYLPYDAQGERSDPNYPYVSGSVTFTAFLDGSAVAGASFSVLATAVGKESSGKYYGFQNILFDELRITSSGFTLDNIQFVPSTVPLPAALPLFAGGLGLMGLIGWRKRRRSQVERGGLAALAAAAVLTLSIAPTHATTWDASIDFLSSSPNPNGVWTYGWKSALNGTLSPYQAPYSGSYSFGWMNWDTLGRLNVNKTYADYGGILSLNPGPNGEFSVIQWTSPIAGQINVNGAFGAGGTGSMSYYVAVNGLTQLSWINEADSKSFSLIVNVGMNDTVSFIVGLGIGSYDTGLTPLTATISSDSVATPLPAALPLFLTGAGFMGLLGWRRNRKCR
jgi:hypothetical protein